MHSTIHEQPVRFVLVTQTDRGGLDSGQIRRLFESIPARADIHVVCVFQGLAPDATRELTDRAYGFGLVCVHTKRRLPLSASRNLALSRAEAVLRDNPQAFVAFPDDDGYYHPDFFDALDRTIGETQADVIATGMGLDPQRSTPPYTAERRVLTPVLCASRVSSNTIFVRAERALAIGGFDERFGVGAALRSSEDVDYALRALSGAKGFYDGLIVTAHPVKEGDSLRYYRGNLCVLAKHVGRFPSLAPRLVDMTLVGVKHLVLGKKPLAELLRDYKSALRVALIKRPATSNTSQTQIH